jgi:assimilatory nitrate reductase catalytic subunit
MHRAEVACLWGLPEVPAKPEPDRIEMFQAAADGEIEVLWIACRQPSTIHARPTHRATSFAKRR